MAAAADILAANLGHLQHPNGTIIALPGFDRHASNHPELGEIHGKFAQLIGEAMIHTLELNGYLAIDKTSIPTEPEPEPDPWITLRCTRCDQQLARINTTNPQHINTNPDQLAATLTQHSQGCR